MDTNEEGEGPFSWLLQPGSGGFDDDEGSYSTTDGDESGGTGTNDPPDEDEEGNEGED